ncbi:hypothetical protein AB4876_16760 [Zhongshania guokunii]|uniref:Uncharacterized protein n=1 Tax=Zhongshania guokunii TaxID=641783 RepID=A0ABV3UAK9_9GAMM
MTEPTDKKTHIEEPSDKDRRVIDPVAKPGAREDFFDKSKQHQVGEDFTRGDQLPDPDRNIDWDEIFGSTDEV